MANYTTLDFIKMAISMGLVIFSIVIVTALIFGENTKIAAEVAPAVAFILMWGCILWLTLVEGGKCAVVGLAPVDGELYKDSHPTTNKICGLAHKGDNLDRYLMGRQFMVIFISFVINMCGAPLAGAEVFNFPSWLQSIFLGSGVAMVLTVVVVGQLTTQINATTCMLDYINTHFMTFTLWVALLIEKTGVMHMCYLVKYLVYWLAGKPVVTHEAPRTTLQAVFFYGRCLWSIGILAFSLAVTIDALFKGLTTMWEGVPEGVSVVVFFVLMVFTGLLEGMQIALFAVAKLPKSEQGGAIAMKTCEIMFHGDEKAFARFNVGRQMFVTLCFFVIARVTTLDVTIGVDENIFGVSDGVQKFFNMGFLGAIITTILGSISWQLVASAFPREFLSNPLIYVFALICLALEATGICSGAWFLAIFHRKLNRLQTDEVYIGTAEERAAAKGKADSTSDSEEEAAEPVETEGETGVVGSTDNV